MSNSRSQEVFDKVVGHLRRQNAKAVCDDSCKYRKINADGTILRCAAGCLIDDDDYSEEIEGRAVFSCLDDDENLNPMYDVTPTKLLIKNGYEECLPLIVCLQSCHDNDEIHDWEKKFKSIASMFELTYTSPSVDEILVCECEGCTSKKESGQWTLS